MKTLQEELVKFCQSQKSRLKPSTTMHCQEVGPVVKYQFSIDYKGNWQDAPQRWVTKSMFLFELKRLTSDLEIPLASLEK